MSNFKLRQVFQWMVDGKEIEWEATDGSWQHITPEDLVSLALSPDVLPAHFRVKQSIVEVNGIEIQGPLTEMPEPGETYWLACTSESTPSGGGIPFFEWEGDAQDVEWFTHGMCHSSASAARAHVQAMLAPTKMTKGQIHGLAISTLTDKATGAQVQRKKPD